MTASSSIAARSDRRPFALAGVIILALSTAACFDNDASQRRAFIAFLQTRIVAKPGLHIPILSEKELADIGPYASQYYILNGFHHRIDSSISKDLGPAMAIGSPRSLEDLRDHQDILPLIKSGMAHMKSELEKAEAAADEAHKKLNQPPDLKAVYDIAYRRMVTIPAQVFRELDPMIESMLPAIENLAAFLGEHRDVITFSGGMPVVSDPAMRAELATLMEAAGKAAEASAEGKRKLRAMAEGR